MRDLCARTRGGKRGESGIAKEVEHTRHAAVLRDVFCDPVPLACLLRKDAEVTERSNLRPKAQRLVTHHPARFHRTQKLPLAAVFGIRFVKDCIRVVPNLRGEPALPQCLWLGTDEGVTPKAFQFG